MTTMRDVAKRAGVSVATISHVINGTRKVAPETEKRIKEVMEELDYHPNAVARSLKTQRTHTIGLIVSDISNPFFSTLVRGAEDFAMENGYSLIVCNTDETLSKEKLYIDVLLQKKVDGMIIAPTGKNDQIIRRLLRDGIQLVFVDRRLGKISAGAVLSQNEDGAYQATSYLIQQGHRRIGIVLGLPDVSTTIERLKGYQRALSDTGIESDQDLIIYGHSQVDGGMEACRKLFQDSLPPTAVFATNNLMTIGVMKAIRQLGLRCPEDVSVIGFDDFEWAEAFDPLLTTVAQQPYRLGYEAAQLLLDRIQRQSPMKSDQEIRVEVELRVRGSVVSPSIWLRSNKRANNAKGHEKKLERQSNPG